MSLLLEALKRAERQKQRPSSAPDPGAPSSLPVIEPSLAELVPETAMTLEPLAAPEPVPIADNLTQEGHPPEEAAAPETPAVAEASPLKLALQEEPVAAAPSLAAEATAQVHVPPPEAVSPILPAEPVQPGPTPPAGVVHNTQADQRPASPLATPEQQERVRALLGTTEGSAKQPSARNRQLILGGMVLTLAMATAGALFWLDREMATSSILQAQAGRILPGSQPSPAASAPVPPPSAAPIPGTEPQPVMDTPASPTRAERPLRLSAAEPSVTSEKKPSASPREPEANPVGIRRAEQTITIHSSTEAGYAAMANGNLDAAREHYQTALKSDQRSRDAQLGLAVTAMREGRSEEAARRYEQVLVLDPRDADANAGIALLRGATDPVGYEGRLRGLIEERGDNAALYHALGSLLARQHRWGEAQEAFFRAVTLAPRSADYHFNLAVSLDHLGQYAQARIYYRKALDLGTSGSPTFSLEAAQTRIAAIDALKP